MGVDSIILWDSYTVREIRFIYLMYEILNIARFFFSSIGPNCMLFIYL